VYILFCFWSVGLFECTVVLQASQTMPPIRVIDTLAPIAMFNTSAGLVFDFGQNFAGWVQVTVSGSPPTSETYTMSVAHAELLDYDTLQLNTFTLGLAAAVDNYTFAATAGCVILAA
jgi:alpha-L-rhamnosidase